MNPLLLLRIEGGGVLIASAYAYHRSSGSWGLFALLFLVPDLSIVGYLIDARTGSITYDAIHTYVGPLLLAAYSLATDHHTAFLIALIWIAHIGFDRLLGFGLKYPTGFKNTHLQTLK
ncbi:MAG TPA: DUF4260 domain-containing protein [Bryobacteraceae bacterium]|jgi:hypothetical protein